jgi:hypothetical protein
VRECTSRGVRMRIVRSFGGVRCKFDALEATSEQPRRVLESRLSWRLKACRTLFRESAVLIRSIRGNSGVATLSARITLDMVLDACCASLGR